jgi:DNA mismatch endonuclease (patch repair protein)
MADAFDAEQRSACMRAVRSKDTKPEKALRSMLHRAGYRFRIHSRNLPGSPDIVFPARRKVIFVHGCFWHQHTRCGAGIVPATRREYWVPKLQRNQARDRLVQLALTRLGWKSLTVWECEIEKNPPAALHRSISFLEQTPRPRTAPRDSRPLPRLHSHPALRPVPHNRQTRPGAPRPSPRRPRRQR